MLLARPLLTSGSSLSYIGHPQARPTLIVFSPDSSHHHQTRTNERTCPLGFAAITVTSINLHCKTRTRRPPKRVHPRPFTLSTKARKLRSDDPVVTAIPSVRIIEGVYLSDNAECPHWLDHFSINPEELGSWDQNETTSNQNA